MEITQLGSGNKNFFARVTNIERHCKKQPADMSLKKQKCQSKK
jgi:hypothetical protein